MHCPPSPCITFHTGSKKPSTWVFLLPPAPSPEQTWRKSGRQELVLPRRAPRCPHCCFYAGGAGPLVLACFSSLQGAPQLPTELTLGSSSDHLSGPNLLDLKPLHLPKQGQAIKMKTWLILAQLRRHPRCPARKATTSSALQVSFPYFPGSKSPGEQDAITGSGCVSCGQSRVLR